MELSQALLCLDVTEEVVEEAIQRGCNLIIAHHPLIFNGLKRLNGNTFVERCIIKAVQNNLAIYAIHTNLDNVATGVNQKLGEVLGLKNLRILRPLKHTLRKLVVFCPESHAVDLRFSLFEAGAGGIGNYDQCSFNVSGMGTFRATDQASPFVGKKGELHYENEVRIELIYPVPAQNAILNAMFAKHPYEEVAYTIYSIENSNQSVGSGMVGELEVEMEEADFLQKLKNQLGTGLIRHTKLTGKNVRRVAICGGSGSFLLKDAIQAEADFFVTADYKYHDFFDAENRIVIADVGHYESEKFTKELLRDFLMKKIRTFAPLLSNINTNPVNYY
jgi:dinuclear metal center YbgI/SA1388 family protein